MTREKADLVNTLISIEDRIDDLWDYHPENPQGVDVVSEFERLQKLAILIESQIDELGEDDDNHTDLI